MSVPEHTRALIAQVGGLDLIGVLTERQECQGSVFHSPRPLIVRCYWIGEFEGEGPYLLPNDEETQIDRPCVWLCGVCSHNLQVFLLLMRKTKGAMGWLARREFGNQIRALGQKAWEDYEGNPGG